MDERGGEAHSATGVSVGDPDRRCGRGSVPVRARRVCCIRHSIYPEEATHRREVEALLRAGCETHVICLARDGGTWGEETVHGVFVHRLPLRRKRGTIMRYVYDYGVFAFFAGVHVTFLHLKHRFDAIQVNTMPDFLVFAAAIPKLLGAKIVLGMQEPVPELWEAKFGSAPPGILKVVEQWALSFADASFTVTEQLKARYVQRGARGERISVVLNVPDHATLRVGGAPVRERSGGTFTLMSHGTIEERYGFDTLLEAVALVRHRIPGLRVRIMGEGTYVPRLLERRKRLGLEPWVEHLGWVSWSDVLEELRGADAGVVAVKSSPYADLVHTGKMYEFMAASIPVIASRLTAVEAYFDERAITYFESDEPASLAEAILRIHGDPARRVEQVACAARLYESYSWEKQQGVYLSNYGRFWS